MTGFCAFCMVVAVIAGIIMFWEFFAAVGCLLILYVCGYIVCSWINPEIEINYRVAAQEYVQVLDQIGVEDNAVAKDKLIHRRDKLTDQMRSWINEKGIWKKYDKTDQEHGIELAMTARIDKEEKTIRKRQEKEKR